MNERVTDAIPFDPADGAIKHIRTSTVLGGVIDPTTAPAPLPRVRSAMVLAEEWGIKRSTMRRWLRTGRLKGRKIDRLWLVDMDDFERLWSGKK